MKYLLFLFLVFFLLGCQCKKYLEPFTLKRPVISTGFTYVDLHDRQRFKVGIDIPGNPSETIKLPNDSIVYVIGIDFDGDSTLVVREGSLFTYAQNLYKVVKIPLKFLYGDNGLQGIPKGMYLQLLETPKHCKCQNTRLKNFDKKIKYIDIDSLLSN